MLTGKTMGLKKQIFFHCVILLTFLTVGYGMTRQQLKNSGKLMKKSCMPKNDVTEEEIGSIEQGKFIEDRRVMCYIACVYTMTQVVKNNKLSHEAVLKQVDVMFPLEEIYLCNDNHIYLCNGLLQPLLALSALELKEPVRAAAVHCKDISRKYKDICEASYWTAKCMYDYDSSSFVFP